MSAAARTITVIGAGPGSGALMTVGGLRALQQADVVAGSPRLLGDLPVPAAARRLASVRPAETRAWLEEDFSWSRAVVAMSGDTGVFSGARRLLEELESIEGCTVTVLPGVSAASCLAARLGRPWQDWRLRSAHGADFDVAAEAARGGSVLAVTSGGSTPAELCARLADVGWGETAVTVAERLSYADERIVVGTAARLRDASFDALNVVLFDFGEPECGVCAPCEGVRAAWPWANAGIPDDRFERGAVPMTKQEVRAVALAKLRVAADDVVYDVGAGTGSVSVEAALLARRGRVLAVERSAEGAGLVARNAAAFGLRNVEVVRGSAPEALAGLPAPDAVFVGGSGGALAGVLDAVLAKNPAARVCVACVTLETLAEATSLLAGARFEGFEACQVGVSRAQETGPYHLMKAQNPVFLASARGAGGAPGANDGALARAAAPASGGGKETGCVR